MSTAMEPKDGRRTEFFSAATRLSLKPRFSGVNARCWGSLNRFSGFAMDGDWQHRQQTAEAVSDREERTVTPLKQDVNESAAAEYRKESLINLLERH